MNDKIRKLSDEQIKWVKQKIGEWLSIKEQFEPAQGRFHMPYLSSFRADFDHSCLLMRLLRGEIPHKEPRCPSGHKWDWCWQCRDEKCPMGYKEGK